MENKEIDQSILDKELLIIKKSRKLQSCTEAIAEHYKECIDTYLNHEIENNFVVNDETKQRYTEYLDRLVDSLDLLMFDSEWNFIDSFEKFRSYLMKAKSINGYAKMRKIVVPYPEWNDVAQDVLRDIAEKAYSIGQTDPIAVYKDSKLSNKFHLSFQPSNVMEDIFSFTSCEDYVIDIINKGYCDSEELLKENISNEELEYFVMESVFYRAYYDGLHGFKE